jgi:hypothetical protein
VGIFTYDKMTPGAQWTALWYRNGELVNFETLPWDGATGGFGFTEWTPSSDAWLPGIYEVQLFVGSQWISSGQFTVTGDPPTPVPTKTSTRTPLPTATPAPTRTPVPTRTPIPTRTIGPTLTWTPTITRTVTRTPTITRTPTMTFTHRPTDTSWPTLTPEKPKK